MVENYGCWNRVHSGTNSVSIVTLLACLIFIDFHDNVPRLFAHSFTINFSMLKQYFDGIWSVFALSCFRKICCQEIAYNFISLRLGIKSFSSPCAIPSVTMLQLPFRSSTSTWGEFEFTKKCALTQNTFNGWGEKVLGKLFYEVRCFIKKGLEIWCSIKRLWLWRCNAALNNVV